MRICDMKPIVVIVGILWIGACGETGGKAQEQSTDTSAEGATETHSGTDTDTDTDTDADTDTDTDSDTDTDTDTDTDADADTDADTDADADADTDGDKDTAADTDSDVDTDTGTVPGCFDLDRDGHCPPADCSPRAPEVFPGAPEVCGNALDDNCDGNVDEGCITGPVYYVDRDSIGGPCSDDGPGTVDAPWCTVDKANDTLTGGETVLLRAGTYEETIQPVNSGSSDTERITYAAMDGETVTFTASLYCLRLESVSYITVSGIRFYNCERNLYMRGASHNNVTGCEVDTPAGPVTWAGSLITDGSQYNRVTHCTFSRYGAQGEDQEDTGIVLDIGSDNDEDLSHYNLVMRNTFSYGGHHILGVYSNYNVIRENTFHNEEWYPCHRTDIGGLCGNRNVITNASQPDINIRNVFDDNHIVFSGVPPDQDSGTGLSLRTQHNIVRRNIFYHNDSAGVTLSNDGGNQNNSSNNYIYNNVFFHNGYTLFSDWHVSRSGLLLARWVDDAEHNPMTGVAVKNNILHQNMEHGIYLYYVDEAEQTIASNFDEAGDPGFVDIEGTPVPADFTLLDFRLEPTSPCVDAGGFLTVTGSAGDNATEMQVEDANYFTDGYGIVEGDWIQLEGQSAAIQIERVDYETNTLTLRAPSTWAAGTGIALPFAGSAPDQGVFELRE